MTLKRLIQRIKLTTKRKNQTIDQLALRLIYLKFMNDFYLTKCILIVRDIAPYTACWL